MSTPPFSASKPSRPSQSVHDSDSHVTREGPPKGLHFALFRQFLRCIPGLRSRLATVTLLALASAGATLAFSFVPLMMSRLLRDHDRQGLLFFLAGMLVLVGVNLGVGSLQQLLTVQMGQGLVAALQARIVRKLGQVSLANVADRSVGEVAERFLGDLQRIRQLAVDDTVSMIQSGITLFVLLTSLAIGVTHGGESVRDRFAIYGGLAVLVALPALFHLSRAARNRVENGARIIQESSAEVLTGLVESMAGYRDLVTSGKFGARATKIEASIRRVESTYRTTTIWGAVAGAGPQLFFGSLPVVFYAYVALGVVDAGSDAQTHAIGMAASFATQLVALQGPLIQLMRYTTNWTLATPSFFGVAAFLGLPEIESEPSGGQESGSLENSPSIRFRGVTYAPPGGSPILHGVTFDIPAGSYTAIVGESGSGKTTLFNLLLRLIDPIEGEILLNDRRVEQWDAGLVRRSVGFIPQDPFMFDLSLRENLLMAQDEPIGDVELSKVIDETGLEECIAARRAQGGLDARVGHRGLTLSGGERQRVALGRLLLRNPSVVVADEYTANIDNATIRIIQEVLRQRFAGRTRVVITHQLFTVRDADQILVLEKGRVVQRGTHAELVASPGLYRRLWEVQRLE